MSTTNFSVRSIVCVSGLALLATVVFSAAQPSSASAATAEALSVQQSTPGTYKNVNGTRRHRQVRHMGPRDAYDSYPYVGEAGGGMLRPYSGYNYGYGVGDNSRNQTW